MQPLYVAIFGFKVFGLGFITSMVFIFAVGAHPPCLCCMARHFILLLAVVHAISSRTSTSAQPMMLPAFIQRAKSPHAACHFQAQLKLAWPGGADPLLAPATGAFAGSWLGGLVVQLGEWIIKKLPLVKHIYSAAKQVPLLP